MDIALPMQSAVIEVATIGTSAVLTAGAVLFLYVHNILMARMGVKMLSSYYSRPSATHGFLPDLKYLLISFTDLSFVW